MTATVIGVNLTWLVPGVVGGSEEYTMRLLQSVVDRLPDDILLRLYAREELIEAYPSVVERHQVLTVPRSFAGSKPGRVAVENSWLPIVSRGDHVMHHGGGIVPLVRSTPAVVTVHDPQPLDLPQHFGAIKRHWIGRMLPYSVRVARLVVCPSRFTAERLRTLLEVPESKLRVVLHGHPGRGSSADLEADAGADESPSARFGRYLLYPAIAYPHKRHVDVVRTLSALGPGHRDVAAVFTGRPGPMLGSVLEEAERLGVRHRVHVLGRVPGSELEALYRSAVALVFPSQYEGFGNPALEAMTAGCPVVASDAGALPEVIGDGGVVVPVGDIGALSNAVTKILADRTFAEDLVERGRARARRFDIGIAAGQLADVYGELAQTRRS